jgi:Bacterial archaeo-eukaryotic release factor family 3
MRLHTRKEEPMDLLSRDDLATLLETRPGWHISMFMPMVQRGAATQQNPIRCKTLLRQAEEQLLANGLRPQEARDLMQPVQKLLPNRDFWQRQSHGLAFFTAPHVFRAYRVPLALEELVVVNYRFHIKPLLPLLSGDGHFFMLALSQKAVRLLRATRFSIDEVELPGVPQGVAAALQYDDVEKRDHHYPGPQGRPAGGVAPFAGHGVDVEDATHQPHDAILRYCQQVDTSLRAFLRSEHAPLVLAGVEYLLPIYRRANTYPYLLEEAVTGNPEGLRPEELHERAWAVVQPHFQQAQEGAAAQYRGLVGTGRATSEIPAIVMAAYDGRIDTLFVAVGVQQWGIFDAGSRGLEVHQEAVAGDDDLLDLAAMYTLLRRGIVYAVPPHRLPDQTSAAAILRY